MIPVIWLNLHPAECHPKDHWDTSIFQELILKGYEEWNGKPEDFPKAAVVMIAGRFHADDLEAINRTLGFMDGCVVVIHSDEESLFPWWELEHQNMRRWVMTPDPGTREASTDPRWRSPGAEAFDGVRFIGEGWSPGTPEMVRGTASTVNQMDWAFIGQVTHERRFQCAAALREMPEHRGQLVETTRFAGGPSRQKYLSRMCQAKLAPCPSGPVTADSFRVYEALEAGCIPILDGIDGKGRDATNLWHLIFGPQCPLPIIHDWAKLPTMVEVLLEGWETRVAMIQRWWAERKQQWVDEMEADVMAVRDVKAIS